MRLFYNRIYRGVKGDKKKMEKYDYIKQLKEQIEELEYKLFELKTELAEKQGYKTLEELETEY